MPSPVRRRRAAISRALAALVLAAAALSAAGLMLGARAIPASDVLAALASGLLDPGSGPGDAESAVVLGSRLPRTLLALIAGAAMGLGGALIQSVTRNPLADTGALGINAGAAFSAVTAISLLGVASAAGYVWFALAGALAAGLIVVLAGGGTRGADPVPLVLAGVALSAVLSGIGEGLALVDPQSFDRLRAWMTGSLSAADPSAVPVAAAGLAAGSALTLLAARHLDALSLGEDVAASLGVPVRRTRLLCVAAVTVLAGSATAAVGVLVFLGLMAPHAARRVAGPSQRGVLLLSTAIGPCILLTADIAGRFLLPGELPAGVVVAFIGAPVLVAIARRRKAAAL